MEELPFPALGSEWKSNQHLKLAVLQAALSCGQALTVHSPAPARLVTFRCPHLDGQCSFRIIAARPSLMPKTRVTLCQLQHSHEPAMKAPESLAQLRKAIAKAAENVSVREAEEIRQRGRGQAQVQGGRGTVGRVQDRRGALDLYLTEKETSGAEPSPLVHLHYNVLLPRISALAQDKPLAFPDPSSSLSSPSHTGFRALACAAAIQRSFSLKIGDTAHTGPMKNRRFDLRCSLQGRSGERCPFRLRIERWDVDGVERWIAADLRAEHNQAGWQYVEEASRSSGLRSGERKLVNGLDEQDARRRARPSSNLAFSQQQPLPQQRRVAPTSSFSNPGAKAWPRTFAGSEQGGDEGYFDERGSSLDDFGASELNRRRFGAGRAQGSSEPYDAGRGRGYSGRKGGVESEVIDLCDDSDSQDDMKDVRAAANFKPGRAIERERVEMGPTKQRGEVERRRRSREDSTDEEDDFGRHVKTPRFQSTARQIARSQYRFPSSSAAQPSTPIQHAPQHSPRRPSSSSYPARGTSRDPSSSSLATTSRNFASPPPSATSPHFASTHVYTPPAPLSPRTSAPNPPPHSPTPPRASSALPPQPTLTPASDPTPSSHPFLPCLAEFLHHLSPSLSPYAPLLLASGLTSPIGLVNLVGLEPDHPQAFVDGLGVGIGDEQGMPTFQRRALRVGVKRAQEELRGE